MSRTDSEQAREFAEGSLRFDDASAYYRPALASSEITLTAAPKDMLRAELAGAVSEFLEGYLRNCNVLDVSDGSRERPLHA